MPLGLKENVVNVLLSYQKIPMSLIIYHLMWSKYTRRTYNCFYLDSSYWIMLPNYKIEIWRNTYLCIFAMAIFPKIYHIVHIYIIRISYLFMQRYAHDFQHSAWIHILWFDIRNYIKQNIYYGSCNANGSFFLVVLHDSR